MASKTGDDVVVDEDVAEDVGYIDVMEDGDGDSSGFKHEGSPSHDEASTTTSTATQPGDPGTVTSASTRKTRDKGPKQQATEGKNMKGTPATTGRRTSGADLLKKMRVNLKGKLMDTDMDYVLASLQWARPPFGVLCTTIKNAPHAWLDEFLSRDGLVAIVSAIQNMMGDDSPSLDQAVHIEHGVRCVSAVMNHRAGIDALIDGGQPAINNLTVLLAAKQPVVKKLIWELLSVLCMYSSHACGLVLDSFSLFEANDDDAGGGDDGNGSAGIDLHSGFEDPLRLIIQELQVTAHSDAYLTAVLGFVNALLRGTPELAARLQVRRRLLALGLLEVLESLRVRIESPDFLLQADVFQQHYFADINSATETYSLDTSNPFETFAALNRKLRDDQVRKLFTSVIAQLLSMDDNQPTEVAAEVWKFILHQVTKATSITPIAGRGSEHAVSSRLRTLRRQTSSEFELLKEKIMTPSSPTISRQGSEASDISGAAHPTSPSFRHLRAKLKRQSTRLPEHVVRSLHKLLPGDEDVAMLNAFDGDPAQLNNAERFLYKLVKIPLFRERVRALELSLDFGERHNSAYSDLTAYQTVLDDINSSTSFQFLLFYVREVGNFVNYGGYAGGTHAFTVSSLLKLRDVKSNEQGRTLLHAITEQLGKHHPDVLVDLKSLHVSLRQLPKVDLDTLKADITALESTLRSCAKRIIGSDIEERFKTFFDSATEKVEKLKEMLNTVTSTLKDVARFYFHEEDSLLGDVASVCGMIVQADEDNVKLAEKRERQKQQEKQRKEEEERKAQRKREQEEKRQSESDASDDSGVVDDLLNHLRGGFSTPLPKHRRTRRTRGGKRGTLIQKAA
ncbi:hypothetical protein PTSG_12100 [Salpingoeca rosetta]|uniref:FH2 domain-containing protein n=1 Tax=Salpingoeca rosetta (strain ATCC 50818 / BSB-021) TaxID=946362 RepID=F2U7A9_SALR5|nr:uncharacterized protein PTSG_12100 [Salpingoeca rosetta]EGD83326.1 hypothetical protein PTSG_12100 [Salpingoeca rosetta]|eukprot:XP_004994830.1 hypothetical protein PTSG_12100 [Salpingoeca rosetta]